MKLALKFRKSIPKEGSWSQYLMGEILLCFILSHFQYYLFLPFFFLTVLARGLSFN